MDQAVSANTQPAMAEEAQVELYYGRSRRGIEASFRLLVPKEWRTEGGPSQFMILPWPLENEHYDYLLVLPMSRCAGVLDDLKKRSHTDEQAADFKRVIGSSCKKVAFDRFGRLALSESLLRDAGITDEAELVGCVDHFEIWNPSKYEAAKLAHKKSAAEIKKGVFI